MTIAMTHESIKYGPMIVHAMVSGCGCEFSVKVTAADRMGRSVTDDGYVVTARPMKKPKDWYRMTENVLLATGKITARKDPWGIAHLECKEHVG